MNEIHPIPYSMENIYGHFVATVGVSDWPKLGEGTLERIPRKMSELMRRAEVVAIIASGFKNIQSPEVYEVGPYTVIQKLTAHPNYKEAREKYGMEDTEALRDTCNAYTWIVGDQRKLDTDWATVVSRRS